ncbi:MAG: EscU/YscU/HrcU family type III secretion system export apparatus switch protein [Longimicrobiales bacterium]
MAASNEDKTEQATPRRQEAAFQEGRLPRSQDLHAAVMLLAAGLALGPGGSILVDAIARAMRASLAAGPSALSDPRATVEWLRWVGTEVGLAFLPFAAAVGGVALLVGAGQARGTFTTQTLRPDWSRLSPVKNVGRFLSIRPLIDLVKALFKFTVVGAVVYFVLAGALDELSKLPQSGPTALVEALRSEVARVMLAAGLAMLALAVADYGYQSWQHQRELRMTKDEVKREQRETEGDPLIRARLRSLGRSLARMRMMSAVPTADVVVVNPVHIAVALRYDASVSDAPIVVAMGTRKVAEKIRRIAFEAGVPVIENPPVARALFATTRVGKAIPPALYMAVAEILAFVYKRRRPGTPTVEARA